jgi:hypothetical protein
MNILKLFLLKNTYMIIIHKISRDLYKISDKIVTSKYILEEIFLKTLEYKILKNNKDITSDEILEILTLNNIPNIEDGLKVLAQLMCFQKNDEILSSLKNFSILCQNQLNILKNIDQSSFTEYFDIAKKSLNTYEEFVKNITKSHV